MDAYRRYNKFMKIYITVALLFALCFMSGCAKDNPIIKGNVIKVNAAPFV